MTVVLCGALAVPCHSKSAICEAESPTEGFSPEHADMLTGRRATDGHEPRQVRKEAAIRDAVCVVDRSRSYSWLFSGRNSTAGAQPSPYCKSMQGGHCALSTLRFSDLHPLFQITKYTASVKR